MTEGSRAKTLNNAELVIITFTQEDMIRLSPGPKKCPAVSEEATEFHWCVRLWRSRDFPVASCPDTSQPIVFARRHQRCAAPQARRHQSHPERAVRVCLQRQTPTCVSNYSRRSVTVVKQGWEMGLRRFDAWLNQRFRSSVSARLKRHFHQKINFWRQFLWTHVGKIPDFTRKTFEWLQTSSNWQVIDLFPCQLIEEALSNQFYLI